MEVNNQERDNKGKIAIILSNYNMPEMTDYLVDYFQRNVDCPYELIVMDNGSDKLPPSKYTTIRLSPNMGANASWQVAFTVCDRLEKKIGEPFFAYFLCCTNVTFPKEEDVLTPLVLFLRNNKNAVGINPGHTHDSGTPWKDHFDTGSQQPRRVPILEWTTGLYRASWMKKVGRIEPEFYYNWGLDIDLSVKAKITKKTLWIHEGVLTTKQSDVGYTSGRFGMSAQERAERSLQELDRIFRKNYGRNTQQLKAMLTTNGFSFREMILRIKLFFRSRKLS